MPMELIKVPAILNIGLTENFNRFEITLDSSDESRTGMFGMTETDHRSH
jgi:hypothetical protein